MGDTVYLFDGLTGALYSLAAAGYCGVTMGTGHPYWMIFYLLLAADRARVAYTSFHKSKPMATET